MYKLEPAVAVGGEVIIHAPHLEVVSHVHGGYIFENEGFSAMQLSLRPERVAPLFTRLPATTRARLYETDGVLIVDSDRIMKNGQLTARDTPDTADSAGLPSFTIAIWPACVA